MAENAKFDSPFGAVDDDAETDRLVREIYGSVENIERLGSPIEAAESAPIRYIFFPTWRSQLLNLMAYVVLCILAVWGSHAIDATVIKGRLFDIGGYSYYLNLPLLTLIPGVLLGKILIYIYDAKYIIDERGVEAHVGLVSMELRQPRLRWEDIRGVEPNMSLWERVLGIGTVLIGSAMTQDVEIIMEGVANPRAIQLLIGGERDRRLQDLRGGGANQEYIETVTGAGGE